MDSRTDARLYRLAGAAHHLHASRQLGRPAVLIRFARWRLHRAMRAALPHDLDMPAEEWWSAVQRRYNLLASIQTLRSPNPWRAVPPPVAWCDPAEFPAINISITDRARW
ncbi:hypothetical protein [Nocardia tengchongensis]|uniref:hypothetical protein n=1 Tax=Nocardia tengchongensis TaxID=2055889 RepID=UPI0036CBB78D